MSSTPQERPERLERLDPAGYDDEGDRRRGRDPALDADLVGRVDAEDRRVVQAREKAAYGGVKVGAAFFGWLTATGMAVMLTAVVGAAGAAVGVARSSSAADAAGAAADDAGTVGVAGAVALAVVIFLSYLAGGYVAGRMARWDGARQGVAVWLWAVVVAVVVAVVTAVAGARYDVLGRLNSFPRLGVDEGTVTSVGLASLLVAAVLSLVGAVLGGLAGMHYHRKIDRAGFAGPR